MKLLAIVGTRPEAIKMAPVLRLCAERQDITSILAVTGQHPDLLGPSLAASATEPDFDLKVSAADCDPLGYVAAALPPILRLVQQTRPDRVIVQGDTASAMAGAEAASLCALPLSHVEAGLRTHCERPWPEEPFRKAIDALADQLLAPTHDAAANLRAEGLRGAIHVTGNSGIDALLATIGSLERDPALGRECDERLGLDDHRPIILVTLHRRENAGLGVAQLCAALRTIAASVAADIVFPLHPNPLFGGPIRAELGDCANVHLLSAQDPPAMVRLMQRCTLILTDSGGLQEEAPSLGKPVLVLREETERPEGIDAGIAKLVGVQREAIIAGVIAFLRHPPAFPALNPYGDGRAAGRIVSAILGEPYDPFPSPIPPSSAGGAS